MAEFIHPGWLVMENVERLVRRSRLPDGPVVYATIQDCYTDEGV